MRTKNTVEPAVAYPPAPIALRYIGGGAALPDVPARDLDDAELDVLARDAGPRLMGHGGRTSLITLLLDSGLYTEA